MNRYLFPNSGLGCALTFLMIGLILTSINLGWVFHGFLIVLALLFLTPIVAWLFLKWWLKRNLVESSCPVCQYQFTSFNNTECQCPNCGEPLRVESGKFLRFTPPGTIDVQVVDVSGSAEND